MSKKTLTVLIPTHNRGHMIFDCLESLRVQTFKDFTVIIYDDGSTDDSQSKVLESKYFKELDITYIYRPKAENIGVVRGFLLDQVRTPFACWQDSDDLSHPTRFEKQLKYLETNKDMMLVMSYIQWMDEALNNNLGLGQIDTKQYDIKEKHPLRRGKVAFATSLFRAGLGMVRFESSFSGEDALWLNACFRKYPNRFGHIPEPLYIGRKHENRISVQKRRK